jgi:hypothetical protein
MENKEIWKDIVGYESIYQVSNTGKVKSLARKVKNVNGYSLIKGIILKNRVNKKGYASIDLSFKNNKKCCVVHRLVATAFIPNSDNKPQVNHINGIKSDNRLENLEWTSPKENVKHAFDNGLRKKMIGENNPYSKLKNSQVIEIKKLIKDNIKITDIAKMFSVSICAISDIKSKKNWNHL